MSCNRKAEVRSTRSGRLRLTMRGPPEVRFVPIGDVTPVYSITPSTVASNLERSFRPNVLAVLSRRFSLSVPYWLHWTFVHLQRGGADDEDDFGTNPKYPVHEIHARDRGAARAAHRRLCRGCSTVVWRSRVCSCRAGQ